MKINRVSQEICIHDDTLALIGVASHSMSLLFLDVYPPRLRTETDPVSETLCSLVSRIPDDGQSPKPSNSEYNQLVLHLNP
jgi:hypothetical protein